MKKLWKNRKEYWQKAKKYGQDSFDYLSEHWRNREEYWHNYRNWITGDPNECGEKITCNPSEEDEKWVPIVYIGGGLLVATICIGMFLV